MSKVAIQGNASGTGTFTIQAPNSNTDRVLSLPDEAGTVLTSASSIVSNSGPLFRSRIGTAFTVDHNTVTKIIYSAEDIDTDNCFASSTFTPTTEGYYLVNVATSYNTANNRDYYIQSILRKNGTDYNVFESGDEGSTGGRTESSYSDIVYLNGTTDYLDVYAYQYDYTASTSIGIAPASYFSACLIRKA